MKLFNRRIRTATRKPDEPSAQKPVQEYRILTAAEREDLAQAMAAYHPFGQEEEEQEAQEEASPIARLCHTVIRSAINKKASEILIEPDPKGVRVRCRVDGTLHETMQMPEYIQMPMAVRYREMAGTGLAEGSRAEEGFFRVKFDNKSYSVRASFLPAKDGEHISLILLDRENAFRGLNKLGFTPEVQAQLEWLAIDSYGLLLIVGPSGSGRTTTQFSLLNKLNEIDTNIVSIARWTEYPLTGVTHIALEGTSLSYGQALEAALRTRPDIIAVDDVPNAEFAESLLNVARSGIRIFATMRARDTVGALLRLREWNLPASLIGTGISGILAQRLVRLVCDRCKELYEEEALLLRQLGYKLNDPQEKVELARGKGCESCCQTGYRGRIGIYQLLSSNKELTRLIMRNASAEELEEAARANGMKLLREESLLKVLEGFTTLYEVMRVLI